MSESSGRHSVESLEANSQVGIPPSAAPKRPRTRRDTLLVQVGDQLLVFSGLAGYGPLPRCVASTKQGRCRRSVEHPGGSNGWQEWAVEDRYVSALDAGATSDEALIRQRCERHLQSNTPDAVAPDWEMFDPAKHKQMLYRHRAPAWTPEGLYRDQIARRASPAIQERQEDQESLGEALRAALESRVEPPALTVLYRYFDDQNRLLYVGITDNLFARTASHAESSSWMDFAVRSTIERYPTRKEAEKVEREAIKSERPLFNSVHNDTPEARRRLVEYLIEHGRIDLLTADVSRG